MESPMTLALVQAHFHRAINSQRRMMRCEQELEETMQQTQHNVSNLEMEEESVCFEVVGCTNSRPGFCCLNFFKMWLGVRKWLGLWGQYQRGPYQGLSEGFGLIPPGLWMRSLFCWGSWKWRRLLPYVRSFLSCLLDTPQSLALGFQWMTRTTRNYL